MFLSTLVLLPTSVAALLTVIAGRVFSRASAAVALALMSWALTLSTPGGNDFPTTLLLLGAHGGQAVVGLACAALLLAPSRARVAAVLALALLASVSDPLFTLSAIPMLG